MEKGQFMEKGQVHLFKTLTLCEPASSPPRPKPPAKAPLLPNAALQQSDCVKIYAEKISGARVTNVGGATLLALVGYSIAPRVRRRRREKSA